MNGRQHTDVRAIACVGSEWMKCVQEREKRRDVSTESETYRESEGDSICSVSHEMVLVSLGRAKIYLCQSALHSPCL